MTQNLIRNVQDLNSFVLNISAFLSSGSRTQDEQYSSREAFACFMLQWRARVCGTWRQPAGSRPCALPSAAGPGPRQRRAARDPSQPAARSPKKAAAVWVPWAGSLHGPASAPGRDLGSPGFARVWCKVLENPWDRRLSSSQRQTVFIWAPWFTVSSTNMAASKINQWNFTKCYTSDTGIVTSFSRKPQITQQNLL